MNLPSVYLPVGAEPLDDIAVSQVSAADLPRIFDIVAAPRDSDRASDDGIPFDYVVSGCEARAQKMCRSLADRHITAGKVWVFNNPRTRWRSAEDPGMEWLFHVAAYVRERGKSGLASVRVIDPSLHKTRVVTLKRYLAGLHARRQDVRFSGAACYQMGSDGRGSRERLGSTARDSQSEDYLSSIHRTMRGSGSR
jgi:hypothetical protein